MKLYWTPGSCSLAVHIALRETGQPFDMARVDIMTKQLEDGGDYRAVNPRGALPALELDDATAAMLALSAPAGSVQPTSTAGAAA